MAWACPFAQKANNYDSATFILCKKKMKDGEKYKTISKQAFVMCDYQQWCTVTHKRTISDKGKTCPKYLESNK